MAGAAGEGLGGSTPGARIGRIAPDRGRGVGIAGWRGTGCATGRADGGAANNDGVTGSGFGATGPAACVDGAVAAGGAGDGSWVVAAGASAERTGSCACGAAGAGLVAGGAADGVTCAGTGEETGGVDARALSDAA